MREHILDPRYNPDLNPTDPYFREKFGADPIDNIGI